MLYRFPPDIPPVNDPTFLATDAETFAKLKIESKAGKRTVFLTEHTLLFVINGVKLLHFAEHTLSITSNSVFLLKKGIYVMAEYIEEGLNFEAVMIFLPERILRSFIKPDQPKAKETSEPWVVLPANNFVQDFKAQFRTYFNHRLFDYKQLIELKQREILTLLSLTGFQPEMDAFIHAAVSKDPKDLRSVIEENILQPVTISELAKLCNRSLAAFKRDFKKEYNSSPRLYINMQRLKYAHMLLQNTSKPVTEIARECSFESASYFVRAFKRQYGVTPQAIRAIIDIE